MQTAARLSPWWRGAAAAPRTTPSRRARHRASPATRAAPAPAWRASGGAPPRRRGRSPRAASSVFLQQLPAQPPQILLEDINHLLQPPGPPCAREPRGGREGGGGREEGAGDEVAAGGGGLHSGQEGVGLQEGD